MLRQHVLKRAPCFTKGCRLVRQRLLDCMWKLVASSSAGFPEEAAQAVAAFPCQHCGFGLCPRVRRWGKAGQGMALPACCCLSGFIL